MGVRGGGVAVSVGGTGVGVAVGRSGMGLDVEVAMGQDVGGDVVGAALGTLGGGVEFLVGVLVCSIFTSRTPQAVKGIRNM
jgi:hypothetical protein